MYNSTVWCVWGTIFPNKSIRVERLASEVVMLQITTNSGSIHYMVGVELYSFESGILSMTFSDGLTDIYPKGYIVAVNWR